MIGGNQRPAAAMEKRFFDTEMMDEICLENEKFETFVDRIRKP